MHYSCQRKVERVQKLILEPGTELKALSLITYHSEEIVRCFLSLNWQKVLRTECAKEVLRVEAVD